MQNKKQVNQAHAKSFFPPEQLNGFDSKHGAPKKKQVNTDSICPQSPMEASVYLRSGQAMEPSFGRTVFILACGSRTVGFWDDRVVVVKPHLFFNISS